MLLLVLLIAAYWGGSPAAAAQADITDEQLEAASGGRSVVVGSPSGKRRAIRIPLEVYVARVSPGKGNPTRRTSPVRHSRSRYGRTPWCRWDVIDARASISATRFIARCFARRMTALGVRRLPRRTGVLTINGAPAEVFYSASCGGRSEGAAQVWPGATFPYMQVVRTMTCTRRTCRGRVDLTLDELRQALRVRDSAVDLCAISRSTGQRVGQSRASSRIRDATRRSGGHGVS